MDRFAGLAWGGAALVMGGWALAIGTGPKADSSGWLMVAGFAVAALYCAWTAVREWRGSAQSPHPALANTTPSPEAETDYPGAWRGPNVPLKTQIEALAQAGLSLAPGRTIGELLTSWPRADYESDPYNLILVAYGSEVEEEPWGRFFCERVWDFDMECLVAAGDYARVFADIVRITGQPHLVTQLSDDFNIDAKTCEIRYTINGRANALTANVDNDWADYEAAAAFARALEIATGDVRHFWAADNGQASVLCFLTDEDAAKINALRPNILVRYVAA